MYVYNLIGFQHSFERKEKLENYSIFDKNLFWLGNSLCILGGNIL